METERMNKSELQGFRKLLKDNRAELSDGRRHREAIVIETSGDELDRIQHAQERDFAVGALNRESLRLGEVKTALERIDSGNFGICVNCEEDIDAKRLAAVPWAPCCVACQEAADRMASHSQDVDEHQVLNAA
jgi:DnaK suppressor protein